MMGRVRTYTFNRWAGAKRTVEAHTVEFTPTHVVFRDYEGRIVLAEEARQVAELREVRDDPPGP